MPPPIPHFHTSRASPAAVEALHPNHTSPPQITTANIIANHNQPHHHQQRNKRNNNTQPRDVLRHRRVVDPHRLVRLRPARGGRRDGVGRRGAGRRGARLQGLVRVRAACLLICLCGGGRVDCNCCVRCPRAATFRRVCTAGRAPLSRQRNTQDDAHHLIRHPPLSPRLPPPLPQQVQGGALQALQLSRRLRRVPRPLERLLRRGGVGRRDDHRHVPVLLPGCAGLSGFVRVLLQGACMLSGVPL